MGLSESERRMLAEMEKQLHADPQFSDTMRRVETTSQQKLSTRNVALGALIAVAGLAVVLLGIAINAGLVVALIMGVLGFAAMVGGTALALRKTESTVETPAGEGQQKSSEGFMARLEREWDERRGQGR